MQTVVIVVHLMIVVILIGSVLLQKSEGGGLGMGGGAGFMSSRGTANLLTRTTAILAVGFFATSLLLSWMAGIDRKPTTLIGPASQSAPAGGATPVAPPTSGGLLDSLKKADEQQKLLVQKNNAAVDELQANVGRFNEQLKAFKAKSQESK